MALKSPQKSDYEACMSFGPAKKLEVALKSLQGARVLENNTTLFREGGRGPWPWLLEAPRHHCAQRTDTGAISAGCVTLIVIIRILIVIFVLLW